MRVVFVGKDGLTARDGVTAVVLENDVIQIHFGADGDWYDLVVEKGWFQDRDFFLTELREELKSEVVDLIRFAAQPGATISAHL